MPFSPRKLAPVFLFAAVAALTGCGAVSTSGTLGSTVPELHGIAHGGPNPIENAIVYLYATTSGGYGATATLLGAATTGSDGGFTFISPVACPAGQQAYVTVQGGDPGSGFNPNYLLMAALGPCSTISSSTQIYVTEATTVAAAVALRPFISIDASGSPFLVNVGAPANNNAATGTCSTTGAGGATTGCVAAGLSHAFENALNLANSVSLSGVAPTGQIYAVTPSNATGVIPQALLNSLANATEVCVNSGGGTAGDGSACGNFFTDTTPPATGVAPTNTLQALLDTAQYPALTPANVTALFGASLPTSFYQPTLVAAPNDYSVAITYTGLSDPGVVSAPTVTANGSGYTAPTVTISGGGTPTTPATAVASLGVVALNITPNTNTTCTAPTVTFSGGGGITQATATLTEVGGVISTTAYTIKNMGTGYTSAPTAVVAGATKCVTGASVVPVLGVVSVELTNPGAGYTSAPTITINDSTGTGATATATEGTVSIGSPYVETLDANDDVYLGSQDVNATNGNYSFYPALESNGATLSTTTPNTTYNSPRGLALDTLGNLWATDNNSPNVFEMTPSTGAVIFDYATGASVNPWALAIDKANNVWYANNRPFELLVASSYAPATFTNLPSFGNSTRTIAFDQNQNVWVAQYNSSGGSGQGGVFVNTGTATAPVYGTNSPSYYELTTALTGNNSVGISIDASGNAWEGSSTNLYELQGTGGPPSYTGVTDTAFPAATSGTFQPNYNEVDGSGSVWFFNVLTAQDLVQYVISTGTSYKYVPCYLAAGETTCETYSLGGLHTLVDSTGSIWINSATTGRLVQVIGPGTPTWPQLSLGNPGVEPQ